MKAFFCSLVFAALFSGVSPCVAETVPLPAASGDTVIGEIRTVTASAEDTLIDIARRFDIGYDEIVKANPAVNRWVPGNGTKVTVPSRHILPNAPREGILLNLAELRLYYFPPEDGSTPHVVHTYPVSVGRMDWKSPLGETKVVRKEKDPPWTPTESIRAEHAAEGEELPASISGGSPENPLGRYALRLGVAGYLIHGTDEKKANGIGMRVTHGCVRMYPEDIEELYRLVRPNTTVRIIDQPVKIGWLGAELFLEIHSPLDEDEERFEYSHRVDRYEVDQLVSKFGGLVDLDSEKILQVTALSEGIPQRIGVAAGGLPPAAQAVSPDATTRQSLFVH